MFLRELKLLKERTLPVLISSSLLVLAAGLPLMPGLPAIGAEPAAFSPSDQALMKDLALMEDRFFSRQYANDPIEKRLERIELMVFAATQDGSSAERMTRLKKAVALRAQQAPDVHKPAPGSGSNGGSAGSAKPDTSAQYGVLNTLEWRALKKTFPAESLDARLGRLEKKLFGQDSPSMAYFDRVERLKRTLGIGVTAATPQGPVGPAPRARPRSQQSDSFGFGFDLGGGPDVGGGAPGFGGPPGFGNRGGMPSPFRAFPGFGADPFGEDINQTFNQMFRDIQRHMAEMQRVGPGQVWTWDSETGTWREESGSGNEGKEGLGRPAPTPRSIPSPDKLPSLLKPRHNADIPPYADPNSI